MKRLVNTLLCSAATFVGSQAAQARQIAPPPSSVSQPPSPASPSDTRLAVPSDVTQSDTTGVTSASVADIVVTARRQNESLQNVPATVQAISGESLKKLNFTQFQDVAAVVPGLTLNNGNYASGGAPAPSIRGVSYDAVSSPSPTVDIYFNEIPTNASLVFQALYDVGGIEVLRGPQGTSRGRTAPSGAILISSRKPDLADTGGYISMLGTQKGSINGQAAVNVPLIADRLAIRLSGVVDQGQGNFVKSANGGVSPFRNTESGRASLAVAPFDGFDANIVYQYTNTRSRQYLQVVGNGAVGGFVATAPKAYNGPVILGGDRLSASEVPFFNNQRSHQITGAANLSVLGHKLSYVGGYVKTNTLARNTLDADNSYKGDYFQVLPGKGESQSHEIRLASDNKDSILSYAVGYFHSFSKNNLNGTTIGSYLPGAFGSPDSVPNPQLYNQTYTLGVGIENRGRYTEDSFYGTATLKVGSATELTGGIRYIISKQNAITNVVVTSGTLAAAVPVPCALAGLASAPYPGYCNIELNLNAPAGGGISDERDTPIVYSASLSHRFNDAILAYATVGSSWRRGGNNFFARNGENAPSLNALTFLQNETSTSYEAGLKTNFFNRRLRLNVAGFYQKFKNLNFTTQSIPYLSVDAAAVSVGSAAYNVAADATVRGFDADASFAITPLWSLGVTASYADGKVDNDLVPCRDGNLDGKPDTGTPTIAQFRAANLYISQCVTNQSVSRDPIWSATAQSEVRYPVGSSELYLRGLATYNPANPRRSIGYRVPAYTLINLYAGLRDETSRWDVGVFARNLFNKGVLLSRESASIGVGGQNATTFGDSGYNEASYTPPFEAGLSVRFAFGSR